MNQQEELTLKIIAEETKYIGTRLKILAELIEGMYLGSDLHKKDKEELESFIKEHQGMEEIFSKHFQKTK